MVTTGHATGLEKTDLTVGELKSSQVRQSGEHDIEFSAYPGDVVKISKITSVNHLRVPNDYFLYIRFD